MRDVDLTKSLGEFPSVGKKGYRLLLFNLYLIWGMLLLALEQLIAGFAILTVDLITGPAPAFYMPSSSMADIVGACVRFLALCVLILAMVAAEVFVARLFWIMPDWLYDYRLRSQKRIRNAFRHGLAPAKAFRFFRRNLLAWLFYVLVWFTTGKEALS